MAGFIVWLAHQHPSRDERRYCPEQVEKFLRCQHRRRAQGLPHHDQAYYSQLRNAGSVDLVVDQARTAITWLRQYLIATS